MSDYAGELAAHYAAVRARINPPPPPLPLPVMYARTPVAPTVDQRAARAQLYGISLRPPKPERPCRLRNEDFSAPPPMSWRDIVREVAIDHAVHWYDIYKRAGSYRGAAIVRARQEAFYRLRAERGMTLHQIGKFLGGFDHTTVFHGIRRHCSRLDLPFPKGELS